MDYRAYVKPLIERLVSLESDLVNAERALSDKRIEISQLVAAINALSADHLAGEAPKYSEIVTEVIQLAQQSEALEVGITDRIRQIFQTQSQIAFRPTDVRTNLEAGKYDLAKYSNAMATIHMVLKRLEQQQQIVPLKLQDGSAAFRWNPAQPKK